MGKSMAKKDEQLKATLTELFERPLAHQHCELADLVISRYRNNVTLRVFVYGEGGVSLEKCAALSRLIGDILEDTELFENGYVLEVSSPGLDRPLTTARDFHFRAGETVKIRFADSKRKKITAEIVAAGETAVTFTDGQETFEIPLADIDQATIVF